MLNITGPGFAHMGTERITRLRSVLDREQHALIRCQAEGVIATALLKEESDKRSFLERKLAEARAELLTLYAGISKL